MYLYPNAQTPEPFTEFFMRNIALSQDREIAYRKIYMAMKLDKGSKMWLSLSKPLRNVRCVKVFTQVAKMVILDRY